MPLSLPEATPELSGAMQDAAPQATPSGDHVGEGLRPLPGRWGNCSVWPGFAFAAPGGGHGDPPLLCGGICQASIRVDSSPCEWRVAPTGGFREGVGPDGLEPPSIRAVPTVETSTQSCMRSWSHRGSSIENGPIYKNGSNETRTQGGYGLVLTSKMVHHRRTLESLLQFTISAQPPRESHPSRGNATAPPGACAPAPRSPPGVIGGWRLHNAG